jgi:hypothetical protein
MSRIFIVEDRKDPRDRYKEKLEESGHTVESPEYSTVEEFYDHLRPLCENKDSFDFFVLDIKFGSDVFGGIKLYNLLVGSGCRCAWNHVIICSTHCQDPITASSWHSRHPDESFILKIFVETAQIPYDNCIRAEHKGDADELLRIVNSLKDLPKDSFCTFCEQRLSWID